jgi:hypothetical protein
MATAHGRKDCGVCHDGVTSLTSSTTCTTCHAANKYDQHVAVHDYCNSCHDNARNYSYGEHNPPGVPWTPCSDCHPGTAGSTTAIVTGGYSHSSNCDCH